MAEKRLGYRIGATDDTSSVLSKMSNNAKREFGKVQDSIDETASATKQLASVLGNLTDRLEGELQDAERMAEELANALGPEFVAKVGSLDQIVTDLQRIGITADDVAADTGELAAELRRMQDVAERATRSTSASFDDVGGAARRVAGDVDNTRSVVANFAGNAAQEIPGVTGAFGPLGMAIGQFTEYATEGNIALSSLVKAAGPLVLVSAAIAGVSKIMGDKAAREAEAREVTEGYTDAIREQTGALEDNITAFTAKRFIEDESIKNAIDHGAAIDVLADAVQESTADLGELGASITRSTAGTLPQATAATDRLTEAFENAGMAGDPLAEQLLALADSGDYTYAEVVDLVGALDVLKTGLADGTTEAERMDAVEQALGVSTRELGEQTRTTTTAVAEQTRQVNRLRQGFADLLDIERDQMDTQLSLEESMLQTQEALQRAAEAYVEYGSDSVESHEANIAATRAAMDQADAAVAHAEAANGAIALSDQQRTDIQIAALQSVADNLDPSSDVRRNLDAYIFQLGEVPARIATEMDLYIRSNVNPNYIGSGQGPILLTGPQADGGTRPSGAAFGKVNERGIEMFETNSGDQYLLTNEAGRVIPNHRLGGAAGTNITVNVSGVDRDRVGKQVADEILWAVRG